MIKTWQDFYNVETPQSNKQSVKNKTNPDLSSLDKTKEWAKKEEENNRFYKTITFVKPKGLFIKLEGKLVQKIKIGKPLYTLEFPKTSKKFKTFKGWMCNGEIVSLNDLVKEDMILIPCFE